MCNTVSELYSETHCVLRLLPHSWLIQCWLSYMLVMSFVCL